MPKLSHLCVLGWAECSATVFPAVFVKICKSYEDKGGGGGGGGNKKKTKKKTERNYKKKKKKMKNWTTMIKNRKKKKKKKRPAADTGQVAENNIAQPAKTDKWLNFSSFFTA